MAFGWSDGDIASAKAFIVKVSKGLRETGGAASSFQDHADFLDSLTVTLEGIQTLLSSNAHLKWEDALIAQAQRMKDAIEQCVDKAKKFENSLGEKSQRSKLGKVPRKVQWTMFKDSVEELKVDVGRTMSVMNDLVLLQSLESILESSKENSLSFDELKKLSEGLAQLLPSVRDSVNALSDEMKADSQASKEELTSLELRFRTDIQALKTDMAVLQSLEDFMEGQEQRREADRNLWQQDLQNAARSLQSAAQDHLQIQLRDLKAEVRDIVEEEIAKKLPEGMQATSIHASALQLMGSGIAGALGAIIALAAQNNTPKFQKASKKRPPFQPVSPPTLSTTRTDASPLQPRITPGVATGICLGGRTPWLWSDEYQNLYQNYKDSSGQWQTRRKEEDNPTLLKHEFLEQEKFSKPLSDSHQGPNHVNHSIDKTLPAENSLPRPKSPIRASQASPSVGYSSSQQGSGTQNSRSSWGLATHGNSTADTTTSVPSSGAYTTRYSKPSREYGGVYGGGYDERNEEARRERETREKERRERESSEREIREKERRERELAMMGYIIASGYSRDKDRSKLSKLEIVPVPEEETNMFQSLDFM